MSSKNDSGSAASFGGGFFGLLGIVFITLKLCGVVDWPWWIVLAPIWGSFVFTLVLFLLLGLAIALANRR